jgi:mono/diheme cytochrome c family protein
MSLAKRCFLAVGFVLATSLMWSQDGGTVYKSKCAACHGPTGEGKVGPALKGTSLSEDDIVALLTKGQTGKKAPHKAPMSGLTEDQAKAVAQYIKALK